MEKPIYKLLTIFFSTLFFFCSSFAAEEKLMFRGTEFKWVNPFPEDLEAPPGVHHRTFLSPSMQRNVGYTIYLPPHYMEAPNRRFPVVYYLHGGRPGSETRSLYPIPHLIDAMSSVAADPAIYVFVNGGILSHYNYAPLESMGEDLFVEELIPHIDSNYRTRADRSGRAIQGFSQGGRGTTRIMFKYPELFSSGAPGGAAYSVEYQISENNGVEYDARAAEPTRFDFGEGNDAYTLAREYAESDGPRIEIALWGGTNGFNYESIIEYMKYLDSLEIGYKSYFVGGIGHNGYALYQVIGEELINFHGDRFDVEEN